MSSDRVEIALIGYGEVGGSFGRGFLAAPELVSLVVFDSLLSRDGGSPGLSAAREAGATIVQSVGEALGRADAAIVVTPSASAMDVAKDAAGAIREGCLYVDLTSGKATAKIDAAGLVNAAGGRFVDGAILSPPLADGLRAKLFAAGLYADTFAEIANRVGMNVTSIGGAVGDAAKVKLIRSVVTKGMEAMALESLTAAKLLGFDVGFVLDSLGDFFDSRKFREAAFHLVATNPPHAGRRSVEAADAAAMLEEAGMTATMARAAERVLARSAEIGLKDKVTGYDPERVIGVLAESWSGKGSSRNNP